MRGPIDNSSIPAILELLASEDEYVLVGRDGLLVLDLGFDILGCQTPPPRG